MTWIVEMTRKRGKLSMYYQNYRDILISPSHTIELSDFFNPSAYLLAMQQIAVIEKKCCLIDDVTIYAQFQSRQEEKNTTGSLSVSIGGLFLRGCIIDEKAGNHFIVRPVEANSPEYQCSPPIRLYFIESTEMHCAVSVNMGMIAIPAYPNMTAEDLLFRSLSIVKAFHPLLR
mmetsp:Transcript_1849/g.2209  ORF Transcript_1849/g.2209 Transcript_1849/m.2209 type:complete len:173 (-) Transcript_1849:191-709(-)